MPSALRSLFAFGLLLGIAIAPAPAAVGEATPSLSFDVVEGLNINSFLREGPVAAHLLLRSGMDPRVLVAFPAGNSGIGLWFSHGSQSVNWNLTGRPQPVIEQDAKGRSLYGITAEVTATGAEALSFKKAALSSVRVLRDYQSDGIFPQQVAALPTIQNSTITWARDRLDGAAGYRLSLQILQGALQADGIRGTADKVIGFRITALCGEKPMVPITGERLLNSHAQEDISARRVLTFLSYREAFLAGSWRFDTYFGRDTLMSVKLLMPALTPEAVNAGLGAVLTRLSPQGEVAHEENVGEFAVLEHAAAGVKSDAPTFDYKMIDGSFMLAPVAGAWLLDDARGRLQAKQFLEQSDNRHGEAPRAMGADLISNLKFVLHAALPFADEPRAQNMIALKRGVEVGQWRDSTDGLAGGRFPYDVNAVFVPAALTYAERLFASGLLDTYLHDEDRALFSRAAGMAAIWRDKAAAFFEVQVPNASARADISQYAAQLQVPAEGALRALGSEAVNFHALALDAQGTPIPVLHSDEGFEFLFGEPSAARLSRAVTALTRPFPAGLLTPVGIVVANPVYAAPTVQAKMSRTAYHGTVIWSWQQAVLAAGLERQLRRPELPAAVRQDLRASQLALWKAIRAAQSVKNSELWSWSFVDHHFEVAPFGTHVADADESNAAQLWSTVYLSIRDPVSPSLSTH